jgi:hypothetical protein
MIVSIHQPAYMPWLGYFDRIARSDKFIYLDNVQFERNSFVNRNRIKTPTGPIWLTVPVRLEEHFNSTIADIEVDARKNWQRKHLRSIAQNYCRAPKFGEKFNKLAGFYEPTVRSLADFCFSQLLFWVNELGITTEILRASTLPVDGHKSELILNLCKHLGATSYLSGPLGRNYLHVDEFTAAGIDVGYHDYVHPQYPQMHGDFVPAMGIVDYWMNCSEPTVSKQAARNLINIP